MKQTKKCQSINICLYVACVASVSVRLSARSMHFSLFGRGKIGAGAKKCVVGEGKGEKETLARKPHDFEKRPFDTFTVVQIHSVTTCQ